MKRLVLKGKRLAFLVVAVVVLLGQACGRSGGIRRTVAGGGVEIVLSDQGEILSARIPGSTASVSWKGGTRLAACRTVGNVRSAQAPDGTWTFERKLVSDSSGAACLLTERFIPADSSIRWEIEITGEGAPWSTGIQTGLSFMPRPGMTIWTAWGAPQFDSVEMLKNGGHLPLTVPGGSTAINTMPGGRSNNRWTDPLVPVPFHDALYHYGAPPFDYGNPRVGYIPFQGNLFCIPLCTVLDEGEDVGITLAMSPADDVIGLDLQTGADGSIRFSRGSNRIDAGHTLRFSMDIVRHEGDWRSALAWMYRRYPDYFDPPNPEAHRLGGTGAYSSQTSLDFDRGKMKHMGFAVNWQASFDFPYMGMFLPPVGRETEWERFGGGSTTISKMAEYARDMRDAGFSVLNYFNVTEFGAHVRDTAYSMTGTGATHWKDGNHFLFAQLGSAVLRVPAGTVTNADTKPGGPWFTWEGGVAMDCGDAAYREFLLGQARRHITELPASAGICIDRLDWLRMFNERADDGRTWFAGKPARSLLHSFRTLMDTLGPLMHGAGKSILVNNHVKRLDILKHVDGIFDEFTYAGSPLNTTAMLCLNKPALGWTDGNETVINEGGDAFFQKYLYMGVFPMCPFPGNDHSLHPGPVVDSLYLAYGPLLRRMQSRKWVLTPHAVSVTGGQARVNIFRVPEGLALPVVYAYGSDGSPLDRVTVTLNLPIPGNSAVAVQAWHPGSKSAITVPVHRDGERLLLEVPLRHGCAMVTVSSPDPQKPLMP